MAGRSRAAGSEARRRSASATATTAPSTTSISASPAASVLALLGPSGCGKSTLLRAVAGLEPLAAGAISFDGEDLAAGAGAPAAVRADVPGQRAVPAPDGRRQHRLRPADAAAAGGQRRHRVAEMLDLVGLPGYADRPVGDAVRRGGAAGRARPSAGPAARLLLLDEPLAALDTALREQLLVDLRRILRAPERQPCSSPMIRTRRTRVADRVALMRAGRLVQQGTPAEVWRAGGRRGSAVPRLPGGAVELPVGIAELDRFGTGPVAGAGRRVRGRSGRLARRAGRGRGGRAGPDRAARSTGRRAGGAGDSTGAPPAVGNRVRLRARPDGAVPAARLIWVA